jgi:hypothetical protein
VSKSDDQRTRINDKIAASQARQTRGAAPLAALKSLPDEYPPERVATLAGQYPLFTVAAGVVAGVAIGALLPRAFGRKLSRRAVTIATLAGELGLAASRRARSAAQDAGHEGAVRLGELSETIGESGGELRRRASRAAGNATSSARSAGLTLAREAIKLAARARR